MNSLFIISAVGKDQPGLVHSVANVLAELKINIVDINGRLINTQQKSVSVGDNNITVNTANLIAGTYFLQIEDGKRMSLQKIVIAK